MELIEISFSKAEKRIHLPSGRRVYPSLVTHDPGVAFLHFTERYMGTMKEQESKAQPPQATSGGEADRQL